MASFVVKAVMRFTPVFILVLVSLTILKMGSIGLCLDAFMMTRRIVLPKGFALKAECNSKLAVALTIMEDCFVSILDPRTGIDRIPHVLYNLGSDFARLNFLKGER